MGVSWKAGTGSDTQNNKIVNKIDSMLLKEIHVQNKNKLARWLRVRWSLVGVLMYSPGHLCAAQGCLCTAMGHLCAGQGCLCTAQGLLVCRVGCWV